MQPGDSKKKKKSPLSAERLVPRKKLPPLLVAVGERNPERLHWLGASFGVTGALLRLWKRAGFKLVYLRQTTSDLTGVCVYVCVCVCVDGGVTAVTPHRLLCCDFGVVLAA